MNNIKDIRLERGFIRKQDFIDALGIPGFTVADLDRFENGNEYPNEAEEKRICEVLRVHPVELWGEWRQLDIQSIRVKGKAPEPDMEVEELISYLGVGHKNAVSRADLCRLMDMRDRRVRKIIARAPAFGYTIGNSQNGRGYYLVIADDEGYEYFKNEYGRALAVLVKVSPLRRKLKEAGYDVA